MILTISTLTLNLASVYCSIVVRLDLLKVAVTSLRYCGWLCYCSGVVKFLYFIGNSSSSHKSIFLIVFQRLLDFLYSLLVNYLVIVITFSDLLPTNEAMVKYILLPLPTVCSRNTSLGIFSHLCSNCLTRNNPKLIIYGNLASWIRSNSSHTTNITRWLSSVSTARL